MHVHCKKVLLIYITLYCIFTVYCTVVKLTAARPVIFTEMYCNLNFTVLLWNITVLLVTPVIFTEMYCNLNFTVPFCEILLYLFCTTWHFTVIQKPFWLWLKLQKMYCNNACIYSRLYCYVHAGGHLGSSCKRFLNVFSNIMCYYLSTTMTFIQQYWELIQFHAHKIPWYLKE
jgi:hypothetical protein